MRQYTLRRLMFFVPVMLVTSAITFFAVNLVPGDVAQTFLGFDATQEDLRPSVRLRASTDRSGCATSNGLGAS